jgi:hypothetical protein
MAAIEALANCPLLSQLFFLISLSFSPKTIKKVDRNQLTYDRQYNDQENI